MPDGRSTDNTRTTVKMAFFYGAVFALIGVHVPFWPVWLQAKGLGPSEIGAIVAAGVGIKVIFNPLIAHAADRRGQRRPIILCLAVLALAAFTLFAFTDGFWPILLVSMLFFALWSPIMPLGESLTMLAGGENGEGAKDKGGELDYGRIRLWGSLTFIAAAVGTGYVLAGRSPDVIYWILLASLALIVGVCYFLPRTRAPVSTETRFSTFQVLRDRRFVLFIVACALIQSSHSVYYGFGTLNWQAQGFSENIIGWLWAEGVIAEIILFIFGARLVDRFGPGALIAAGGIAGALRWSLTGITDQLTVLMFLQALHAFSFGATHLGAIYFISRRVPAHLSASAQGLYSAVVMGLALGLVMLWSGRLFEIYGPGAYQPMAALSAGGALIAMFLLKRRSREKTAGEGGN